MACNSKKCGSPARCCTNNNMAERVCIDTKRVFDVCIQRLSLETTLNVDFDTPPVNPTVTKVASSGSGEIVNLDIQPIEGSRASRVKYTLEVPILVEVTNAGGLKSTGTSMVSLDQDLVLYVPEDGVFAPTIDAAAVIVGIQNSLSGSVLTATLCVTIITKVVANVILVVPSYGYPILPPCQKYKEDSCSGMFESPIFPE
ncbi:MAG: hypothetical protein WCR54_07875 [Clostridia bacterium]